MRTVEATRPLGAKVSITGFSPEIAQLSSRLVSIWARWTRLAIYKEALEKRSGRPVTAPSNWPWQSARPKGPPCKSPYSSKAPTSS